MSRSPDKDLTLGTRGEFRIVTLRWTSVRLICAMQILEERSFQTPIYTGPILEMLI